MTSIYNVPWLKFYSIHNISYSIMPKLLKYTAIEKIDESNLYKYSTASF